MWLQVTDLGKSYGGLQALSRVSFSLHQGEVLGIIGPNGAGKSTLVDLIGGLIAPDSGRVVFRGIEISGMPSHRIFRHGVARCFQTIRLARELSIAEHLVFSLLNPAKSDSLAGFRPVDDQTILNSARGRSCIETLERCGLWKDPCQPAGLLSYGQQKLLSIVCCTAANVSLILLDEPAAGVSEALSRHIVDILRKCQSSGQSIMIIDHDMNLLERVCDRFIFLDAGSIVCEGPLDKVRRNPQVIEAYLEN